MEKVVQKSVLGGRPFGGTATLVHRKWRTFVKVIATVDRYAIISLGKLLLINIYLPNNCVNIMHEITTLFDEIMAKYSIDLCDTLLTTNSNNLETLFTYSHTSMVSQNSVILMLFFCLNQPVQMDNQFLIIH